MEPSILHATGVPPRSSVAEPTFVDAVTLTLSSPSWQSTGSAASVWFSAKIAWDSSTSAATLQNATSITLSSSSTQTTTPMSSPSAISTTVLEPPLHNPSENETTSPLWIFLIILTTLILVAILVLIWLAWRRRQARKLDAIEELDLHSTISFETIPAVSKSPSVGDQNWSAPTLVPCRHRSGDWLANSGGDERAQGRFSPKLSGEMSRGRADGVPSIWRGGSGRRGRSPVGRVDVGGLSPVSPLSDELSLDGPGGGGMVITRPERGRVEGRR